MKDVLFCAYNPMVVKNLYCILRQDGFEVEIADHMASALRMIALKEYGAVVMDCWPFGISTEDAVQVMRSVRPGLSVLVLGKVSSASGAVSVEEPLDLEILREIIHAVNSIGEIGTENQKINEGAS